MNKKTLDSIYRKENREKETERLRRWRIANPERSKEINRNSKRKTRAGKND